jgi:protein ImuB
MEGMTVADARVIAPDLQVFDGKPGRELKLLTGLAEWCLRYTPLVQLGPAGWLITGCDGLYPFKRRGKSLFAGNRFALKNHRL